MLSKMNNLVTHYLINDEKCRASDEYLYCCICRDIDVLAGRPEPSFYEAMLNRAQLGYPKFETVRRCRQKAQENDPDLKPAQSVVEFRQKRAEQFREWAVCN